MPEVNWSEAMKPLLKKYRNKPHPLQYDNVYQLLVAVVLSAQSSDELINAVTPAFFEAYPDMRALAKADESSLYPYLTKVRGFRKKAQWLIEIAHELKNDKNIPVTMDRLVDLKGIGRKSANVIMRGAGVKAEGVIVDLHVLRVAPRIGIAKGTDPKKIEQQIMQVIPQKDWGEIGMAISFLGRETCRPTNPHHAECPVKENCEYFKEVAKKKK